MQKLPSFKDLRINSGQTVLLRTNYDVPLKNGEVINTSRIDESLPTIDYLLKKKAKIIIISHLGRPGGEVVPELSLKPVEKIINSLLQSKEVELLENLRFDPREEKNEESFAKELAGLADFYINDAFACSHRKHASIIGLPRFLPSAFGSDFLREVEMLNKVRNDPNRPLVVILGGIKKDKIELVNKLIDWADFILIGGKLPKFVNRSYPEKVMIADLTPEGKDITIKSTQAFGEIILKAKTIVWAGPLGLVEEEKFLKGTEKIAQFLIESSAFKVIGGGDTEAVLAKLNLKQKIDYISSGGGAMFDFLTKETLPGIEAILNKND